MDAETKTLCGLLRQRDRLKRQLAATDAPLNEALAAWGASRPGHVKGKTTETGARFVLGQAGLL